MGFRKHFVPIFVAVITFSSYIAAVPSIEGCFTNFRNIAVYNNAIAACMTKLKMNEADVNKLTEDLPKNAYDDKCWQKCVMQQLKVLKEDDSIDLKMAEAHFMENAPVGKGDLHFGIIKKCTEIAAEDVTLDKEPCKKLAMAKMCYVKELNSLKMC